MTERRRAQARQYAQRVNRALALLKRFPVPAVMRERGRRYPVFLRHSRRAVSRQRQEASPVKTAAIYARVSSDRQKEEHTIASQTSALRVYAAAHEYVVPDGYLFEDDGWSGSTLIRPGLERLRDLAAQGQIEVVLVYSPDRLSRRYAYQVLVLDEFARHGVEVVFLQAPRAETPEDVLLVQFQGITAEEVKAKMTERTRHI